MLDLRLGRGHRQTVEERAYVHPSLSLLVYGKACSLVKYVRVEIKTGLGKSDRPGLQGGSWKRELWESD